MNMSTCPNCHQPIASTDDICENCGAVLVPLAAAPNGATSPTPSSSSYAFAGVNTITMCPNCKQPVSADEEICENCGAVLATVTTTTPPVTANTPVQDVRGRVRLE
jgi:serine/threonine-protein kinase PknG